MRGEYEELPCPFCDKGIIQAWHIPSVVTEQRRVTASLPGSKGFRKSAEIWLVQAGCNVCGKSQEEVEKELRKRNII